MPTPWRIVRNCGRKKKNKKGGKKRALLTSGVWTLCCALNIITGRCETNSQRRPEHSGEKLLTRKMIDAARRRSSFPATTAAFRLKSNQPPLCYTPATLLFFIIIKCMAFKIGMSCFSVQVCKVMFPVFVPFAFFLY